MKKTLGIGSNHPFVSLLREIKRAAARQRDNARRAISGRPVMFPPLVSATIDLDDVRLAEELLHTPESWLDPAALRAYENDFAGRLGFERAFAFMSGRESLSACLEALGVGPGHDVITPAYTCVVVPNAVRYRGAEVVFCDIELDSYGIDVDRVRERITPRTRAIIIQHLYGMVCRDYDALINLGRERGVAVIEDCAHATGALWRGRAVGLAGDAAFYSSERSKIFNTITGGFAASRDPEITARLEAIAHAAPPPEPPAIENHLLNVIMDYHRYKSPERWWRNDWLSVTSGSRTVISTTPGEEKGERPTHYGRCMPGAIARVGRNQLRKLEAYNTRRREAAAVWEAIARARGWTPPVPIEGSTPVWLRYPLMLDPDRKRDTRWAESEFGVRPGVWFVSKTHPSPCALTGFPNADEAVARCLNMPTALDQPTLDRLKEIS